LKSTTRKLVAGGALGLGVLAAILTGCGGDEPIKGPAASAAPAAAPAPAQPPADAKPARSPTEGMPALPKREFQERDFAESDANRDPFRGFAADLLQQNKRIFAVQRRILVDRYSLEELKLVGLVNGSPSRALLIDPTGFGWIARVGDFVGKSELVHSGGPTGADVPLNWRVDRIRGGDVVLVREDPSHPEIPPTTRVIALRTVEDVPARRAQGLTVAGHLY
jgi:type IV pilus assembly protein PilP